MIALPAVALTMTLALAVWAAPATAAPRASARSAPPSTVCSQQVGAFRFALNEEFRGGMMTPTTYGFILGDLSPVADACRAGDDAAAGRLLRDVMRRWRFL